jgi:hypothetical protein
VGVVVNTDLAKKIKEDLALMSTTVAKKNHIAHAIEELKKSDPGKNLHCFPWNEAYTQSPFNI